MDRPVRANEATGCSAAAHAGLERCCAGADWLDEEAPVGGVSRLRASLQREAYAPHRHDSYTLALTERGVQEFDYRGGVHRSLPGQIVVLHPDERHDGRAATAGGFSYRALHIDPARIHAALRDEPGDAAALPFVAGPVIDDAALVALLRQAFEAPLGALGADDLVHGVALALRRAAGGMPRGGRRALDLAALARVRAYLDTNAMRIVSAAELEAVSGLSRFTLFGQFKRLHGTSPYRYLLMRRLQAVRASLPDRAPLAQIAGAAGFADQAHMTRVFRAAIGITPAAYARLQRAGRGA